MGFRRGSVAQESWSRQAPIARSGRRRPQEEAPRGLDVPLPVGQFESASGMAGGSAALTSELRRLK
jgi:hypothetical protein